MANEALIGAKLVVNEEGGAGRPLITGKQFTSVDEVEASHVHSVFIIRVKLLKRVVRSWWDNNLRPLVASMLHHCISKDTISP